MSEYCIRIRVRRGGGSGMVLLPARGWNASGARHLPWCKGLQLLSTVLSYSLQMTGLDLRRLPISWVPQTGVSMLPASSMIFSRVSGYVAVGRLSPGKGVWWGA